MGCYSGFIAHQVSKIMFHSWNQTRQLTCNFHFECTTAKVVLSCLFQYKRTCHFTSLHFSFAYLTSTCYFKFKLYCNRRSASSSWCPAPLERVTRCYISLSDNYFLYFSCSVPSLTRGWVCNSQCKMQVQFQLIFLLTVFGAMPTIGPMPRF
jgi:hypothetical protein